MSDVRAAEIAVPIPVNHHKTRCVGRLNPQGVCRDFAHLAITFCRRLNIPARYCTGYVSDIGLPPPYAPMDFAAWMEVYLGGRWHTFDPRNNAHRTGRVLIAYGRDAADVPFHAHLRAWRVARVQGLDG